MRKGVGRRRLSGWRLSCLLALWAWAVSPAAQEREGFAGGGERAFLESLAADQGETGRLALRWRVRGAGLTKDRLQGYRRVEGRFREGEFFLLAERDPGERRWADFSAFYLGWRSPEDPVELVLGDLRPGWGTGIAFGRSSGQGGALLPHPGTDSRRIGYRSSGENQAFRGAALRFRRGGWEGMLTGGWARRDARADATGRIVSLPEGGRHVTEKEEAGRHLLRMQVGGGRVRYRTRAWEAGGSLLRIGFDRLVDLRRPGRKPWAFHGNTQRIWAADGRVDLGRAEIRGEAALGRRGRWGVVAGGRIGLAGMRMRGLIRWFDPGFHSFFGGAPSRNGMQNERGFLLVLEGKGGRLFADRYLRPKRTYFYPSPAWIDTWGGSLDRRLGAGWRGRLSLQEEKRPRQRGGESVRERSRRFRIEVERRGRGGKGRLRLRLEGRSSARREDRERGGLVSLLWRGRSGGMSWTFHCTRFLTDSYRTRIYEFEYDLPGAVSIRPLYGKGWRGYALVGVEWGGCRISLRYRRQRDARIRQYGGMQVDLRAGG